MDSVGIGVLENWLRENADCCVFDWYLVSGDKAGPRRIPEDDRDGLLVYPLVGAGAGGGVFL